MSEKKRIVPFVIFDRFPLSFLSKSLVHAYFSLLLIPYSLFLIPFSSLAAVSDQPGWDWSRCGDLGDGTYRNPVLPADYSDLDCIRVGDDYYAISSTMQYSPGMIVLHSRDLVNWRAIGHVVTDLTQISPELNWDRMKRDGRGIWAGTIRHHAGKFWVYFGTPDEGYFMTTAANPSGPWAPLVCVMAAPGWDDCCPFWDDDGQGYFVGTCFKDGYKTWLFKLTPDGRSLIPGWRRLLNEGSWREASKLYKINGFYYYMFAENRRGVGRYVMMRRAKSVVGPYDEVRQLGHVDRDAREPNQGGLVTGPRGGWYFFTHHGAGAWDGRCASLLPVTWIDGWPVIGDVQADGIGSMVWRGKMPLAGGPRTPSGTDGFSASVLGPQWEWNYQPRADKWSLTERPGFLRLHAFKPLRRDDLKTAGNTLTQRSIRTSTNVVTVAFDLAGMADGQVAGLCHYSADYAWLGVRRRSGGLVLEFSQNGKVVPGPSLASPRIGLRSVWTADGVCRFSFSTNGTDFAVFGSDYRLGWANYRGDRVGIFTYNDEAEAGYVDVDSFLYQDMLGHSSPDAVWICSIESAPWVTNSIGEGVAARREAAPGAAGVSAQDPARGVLRLSLFPSTRYQTLDSHPWGGCFNERGWQAMRSLSPAARTAVVASLFGPGPDSLHLTAGRTPIAASDYAIDHYSYDETVDDYELKHFSIARDRQFLLPYIKAALAFVPDLPLFASPWTPPSWMKTNNRLNGQCGTFPGIEDTPANFAAYAKYFQRYLAAYSAEGVEIAAVTPQNEPTMNTAYTSCVWNGQQLRVFLRDYLNPAIADYNKAHHKHVQVWLGTFTDSNPTMCLPTLEDSAARAGVAAACFQWWGAPLARRVRRQYRDLKLVQSESKCGNGRNDWTYAEEQFDCFKEFLDAGVSQYFLWNMILEGRGPNNAIGGRGWEQNAPITVDGTTVRRRPSYWQVKHFSATIKPGARRIKVSGPGFAEGSVTRHVKDLRAIAFQNPDGEIVLNVKNSTDLPHPICFSGKGVSAQSLSLPAHSINTFLLPGTFEDTPDATFDPAQDPEEAAKLSVKLAAKDSGLLVSVEGASTADGAKIVATSNLGESHQAWTLVPCGGGFYEFRNLNSDLALGVFQASRDPGATVVQWSADNSQNQQWKLVPYLSGKDRFYFLLNRDSSLALTLPEAGRSAVLAPFTAAPGQLFTLTVVSGEFKQN